MFQDKDKVKKRSEEYSEHLLSGEKAKLVVDDGVVNIQLVQIGKKLFVLTEKEMQSDVKTDMLCNLV